MKISIIGLGFVGLSIAVTNASKGIYTYGIDIDKNKISNLKKEITPFFEPHLNNYLKNSIRKNKIEFTSNFMKILDSDITFVTVGTPPKSSGEIDLTYVKRALKKISQILEKKEEYHLVVIKSTLSPLTTKKIILPLFKKNILNNKLDIVVNPEFLREGFAIKDVLEPHIMVIGSENKRGNNFLKRYYKKFYKKLPETIEVGITTAELIKYTNNSFLATKISFINSISNICQKLPDVDVDKVAYAIGKDSRIGPLFLKAGPGFGGSCLPKDLSGMISFSENIGVSPNFFKAVRKVNHSQFNEIIKMMKKIKIFESNKNISILGLSFKKNTDDIRESVSIKIVKKCLDKGMKINVHDPMALENFKKIYGNKINYHKSISSCLVDSNCCLILTEWNDYKKLEKKDFTKMKEINIIDCRRILNQNKLNKTNYYAIGIGKNTNN